MAHLHNTSGFADEARSATDYFPFFASLRDAADADAKSKEMTTTETTAYLRRGFGLFVPTAYRQRMGLPD